MFYYNLKSQQSFWEKPGTLPDDDDLKLTPRSEKLAIEAKPLYHRNQRHPDLQQKPSAMKKPHCIFKAYGALVKPENYCVK